MNNITNSENNFFRAFLILEEAKGKRMSLEKVKDFLNEHISVVEEDGMLKFANHVAATFPHWWFQWKIFYCGENSIDKMATLLLDHELESLEVINYYRKLDYHPVVELIIGPLYMDKNGDIVYGGPKLKKYTHQLRLYR